jgi:hypothetical protein
MFRLAAVAFTLCCAVCLADAPKQGPKVAWPKERAKAKVDPGPAKLDDRNGGVMQCKKDDDCNDFGGSNNICTADGVCLCDASQGYGRCGVGSANQTCSNLLNGLYCGKCGRECKSGQTCIDGKCSAAKCAPGETFCLAHCSNLKTSNFDCGKCGHQCPGKLQCVNGHCEP